MATPARFISPVESSCSWKIGCQLCWFVGDATVAQLNGVLVADLVKLVPWQKLLLPMKNAFSHVSADKIIVGEFKPCDVLLPNMPFPVFIRLLLLVLQFLVVTSGLRSLLVYW